ncbi:disease resistance protein At4g27190 isoform X2 [Ricinus communis]|uniref:disease resistance protein At4g27190 isoform X2 n=1 Tax=Ricinus communis TaxID=3988 RepID=UPI00201A6FF9|nr:disease resistance protein At4g27190 isoform X2 [Ricinus communis]
MEIIISVASKIGENLVNPIGRRIGYLIDYESNVKVLKDEIDKLNELRDSSKQLRNAATSNGRLITHDVESWLTETDKIIEESRELLANVVEGDRTALYRWHPKIRLCYYSSKEAKKKTGLVLKLREKWYKLDKKSYPASPPNLGSMFIDSFKSFQSRESIIIEVMEALKDSRINMISICGMVGVGKTTMVKEVIRRVEAENMFDNVVMAKVSQCPCIQKIQLEISDRLGLKLEQKGLHGIAGHLQMSLRRINRILIVLDDVWEKLNFEEIGLPSAHQHQGCKIVLTSGNQDVCCRMNSQINFILDALSEQEAWKYFVEVAGNTANSPDIHPLAKEVGKKCGGLPVAITNLGNALRGKEVHIWKDVLGKLKKAIKVDVLEMENEVYSKIELSYSKLESNEAKSCFLLCCLFPEDSDIPIEYLVRYGMGLGLFDGVYTLKEGRNRVHALVDKLRTSFLLFQSSKVECVKLHVVVRSTALSIASKRENKFLVLRDAEREGLMNDAYNSFTVLSIVCNDTYKGAVDLDCSRLKFLQLVSINCSLIVKLQDLNSAFEGMRGVQVLAFLDMRISSNLVSFHVLENLKVLCLGNCCFEAMSSSTKDLFKIGILVNLEILSFAGSDIMELPREIGQLSHLRLLDLTSCTSLRKIPVGVLSKLSRLEELYMRNSFSKWQSACGDFEQKNNASIAELGSLSGHLKVLDIHLPEVNLLTEGLIFQNLERFKISVGSPVYETGAYLFQNYFRISGDMHGAIWCGIHKLLEKTQILSLASCYKLECIINARDWVPHTTAFPLLESLSLRSLYKLKEIWHGELPKNPSGLPCFDNLRSLHIHDCGKLKNVFSLSIARVLVHLEYLDCSHCGKIREIISKKEGEDFRIAEAAENTWFPKLTYLELDSLPELISFCQAMADAVAQRPSNHQVLEITSCEAMEGIVPKAGEDEKANAMLFPHLNSLKLVHLPNLMNFCSDANASEWPLLKKVIVKRCTRLKIFDTTGQQLALGGHTKSMTIEPLFNAKVALHMIVLHLSCLDNLTRIGHDQLVDGSLCNIREIEVDNCENLPNVLASNLIARFQNLEKLFVYRCASLLDIFESQAHAVDEHTKIVYQLEEMILMSLPRLSSILENPGRIICFQRLRTLEVYDCGNLEIIFFLSLATSLQQLQMLKISTCQKVEKIVAQENKEAHEARNNQRLFRQLEFLELVKLPNLTCFCEGMYAIELPSLGELVIKECPKVKPPTFGHLNAPKLKKVCIESSECLLMGDSSKNVASQFKKKVALDKLETLHISRVDNLRSVGHDQLSGGFLRKLREMEVKECKHLLNIFPSHMMEMFLKLEKLTVRSCASLSEIFEPKRVSLDETRAGKLKEINLASLPNLTHLLSGVRFLNFQHLEILKVNDCSSLRSIFCLSVAASLQQLKTLKISNCKMIMEIIEKEDDKEHEAADNKIELPELRNLTMENLPSLEAFYRGIYDFEMPSLDKLILVGCPKMKIFTYKHVSTLKLEEVCIESHHCALMGDLNTTINYFTKGKGPAVDDDTTAHEQIDILGYHENMD